MHALPFPGRPLGAALLTNNINEWPAVWCLLSIGLILIVVKTPVRGILYERRWWLWGADLNRGADRVKPIAGNV